MFLQEIKEIGVLVLDNIEKCNLNKRQNYRQKVKDDLRKRFRNEYLGALVYGKENVKNKRKIEFGDLVLIESTNEKRIDWLLAFVKDLIVGNDGKVRVVRLKTSAGDLIRPLGRVYPLELKCEKDEFEIEKIIVDKYENDKNVNAKETQNGGDSAAGDCVNDYTTGSGRNVRKPERLIYH